MTEEKLLRDAARGDGNAMASLIQALAPRIYAFLNAMLPQPQADLALGETFVRLARSAQRFEKGFNAYEWTLGVARRVVRDYPEVSGPADTMAQLSVEDRELVVLKEVMDFDTAELARVVAIPRDEAISRLTTAKKRLTGQSFAGGSEHEISQALSTKSLEDELTPAEERELAIHLVGCPDCKAYHESLAKLGGSLKTLSQRPGESLVSSATSRAIAVLAGQPDPGPIDLEMPEPDAFEPTAELSPEPSISFHEPVVATPEPDDTPSDEIFVVEDKGVEAALIETDSSSDETIRIKSNSPGPINWEPEPRKTGLKTVAVLAGASLIAIALAIAAAKIISRPAPAATPVPATLPAGSDLQRKVKAAYDEIRSLDTKFVATSLRMYRYSQENQRTVFSFSTGEMAGQLSYESPGKLREENTLKIQGGVPQKTVLVRNSDSTKLFTERPDGSTLTSQTNAPMALPDTNRPERLGILEQSLSVPMSLFAQANDVAVLDESKIGSRTVYRLRFDVTPSELTRADTIELFVDKQTSLPLGVKRFIDRVKAGILGPAEVLRSSDLDSAFAGRSRVQTESLELRDTKVNDIVAQGTFSLSAKSGVAEDSSDGQFIRVAREELSKQQFPVLLPSRISTGPQEQAISIFRGKPRPFGSKGQYPAPMGVVETSYTSAQTTITISQRSFKKPVEITKSPVNATTLPLTQREVEKDGKRFVYAISTDVVPHVFGFVGNIFVVVSGYLPEPELVNLAVSLEPVPSASSNPSPRR